MYLAFYPMLPDVENFYFDLFKSHDPETIYFMLRFSSRMQQIYGTRDEPTNGSHKTFMQTTELAARTRGFIDQCAFLLPRPETVKPAVPTMTSKDGNPQSRRPSESPGGPSAGATSGRGSVSSLEPAAASSKVADPK